MSRQLIKGNAIADGTVLGAEIGGLAVTTPHIADQNITNAKIATNTIIAGQKLYNADFRGLGQVYADDLTVNLSSSPGQGIIRMGTGAQYIYWNGGWVVVPAFPTAALADGSVTGPKIADSAVTTNKIPSAQITSGHLASKAVFTLIQEIGTGDMWNNIALGAGINGVGSYPVTMTVPAGLSFILAFYEFSCLINAPTLPQVSCIGWDFAVQNVSTRKLVRHACQSAVVNYIAATGVVYIPTSAWGGGAGSIQFGPQIYASVAVPNQVYMRGSSQPSTEYINMRIFGCYGGL